jgi:hypothetical protein
VDLYAAPGSAFQFAGKVTYLDLSKGKMALENRTDNKAYEIALDPAGAIDQNLTVGSEVTVNAVFDGREYRARQLAVDRAREK